MELYETHKPAQSHLTIENDSGPNHSEVLRKNPHEEDVSSEVAVTSAGRRSQNAPSREIFKKNEFSFISQSEPLSISDHVKNYIQAFTYMPIIWWPFSNPRRPLEQDKTRMTWQCVSSVLT